VVALSFENIDAKLRRGGPRMFVERWAARPRSIRDEFASASAAVYGLQMVTPAGNSGFA
jgi:hypothetical protein